PNGIISTISITTLTGPPNQTFISRPNVLLVDGANNLIVAGDDFRIHRVGFVVVTTIAGNGTAGSSGDGGPATQASLGIMEGMTLDAAGNLYLSEFGNGRVRKVTNAAVPV